MEDRHSRAAGAAVSCRTGSRCPRSGTGLAGVFRGVEVAFRAGHAVRALLEGGVGAQPVAEVVVLPALSTGRGARGDRVAVQADLDAAHVAGEVPGFWVGRAERGQADRRVV